MGHTVFHPTITMCECPCHDRAHPMPCHHEVECCCPHRFLVALDCPSCTPQVEHVHQTQGAAP